MPGLFAMLGAAARALEAQQFGLDVAGQNVANAGTPGYARRVADLATVAPTDRLSAGGGVQVLGMRALRDRIYDRQLWTELPSEAREQAVADGLGVVELAFGTPGESIDGNLARFFDAFARLAEIPTSTTARHEVLAAGESVAAGFRDLDARLDLARRDADLRVRGAVDEVNELVAKIAGLNRAIANTGVEGASLTLQDQQREAVKQLAELVDIQTIERQNGGIDISFALGRPLVVGEDGLGLSTATTPPNGFVDIVSQGIVVTGAISGGRLAGELNVRDTLVPGYQARLDTLAYSVVNEINAVHATGFDLSGAAGGDFFQPLAGPVGAAAGIAVDSALAADSSLVAAAGTPTPGDNQVARSLARLRDAQVLDGGTASFSEYWAQLVFAVGSDAGAASSAAAAATELVRQVEALRDGVSGVSLDEEAAMMLRFERAYQANARYFQTVDESLEILLSLGA